MLTYLFHRNAFRRMACLGFIALTATSVPEAKSSEHWQGDDNCEALFETPLQVLPGGSHLKENVQTENVQADALEAQYIMANGITLKLTIQAVEEAPVTGSDFKTAYRNLFKQKPLQDSLARRVEEYTTLAEVNMLFTSSMYIESTLDGSPVTVDPEDITLTINAKIRIADWIEYEQAQPASQQAWDRHKCVSYHHEFGHILIAAQMFEDTQDEWSKLEASSIEAFDQTQKDFFSKLTTQINKRQDNYHDMLQDMGPALGESRPYLELPFPWLEGTVLQNRTPVR